jgi:hypothetical protein
MAVLKNAWFNNCFEKYVICNKYEKLTGLSKDLGLRVRIILKWL